jgi:acetylornithine deacetylase/succinyl-diaminopimelate desuccinylase-like protein
LYERLKDVFAFIDNHQDEFVADLQRLLRQPSVAAHNLGLEECADLVVELLQKDGLPAVKSPTDGGPPVVFADIPTSDSENANTLLCYGHYDVQPADPLEKWISDPWGAHIIDGVIYGRGATDNKGGIMAFAKAAYAFQQVLGEAPVNLKFLFEGDEEIGSPHLESWCLNNTELIQADGMHCLDGDISGSVNSPQVELGLKAILYVELVAHGPKADVYSGDSPWVVNPAWRLVQALNTLVDEQGNVMVDGWYDDFQAPDEMDEELLRIESERINVDAVLDHFGIEKLPWGKSPYELMKARQYYGTCTICGITGGYQGEGLKTIVPSTAKAKIDFRLPPRLMPEIQLEKLQQHLTKRGYDDIEIRVLTARGTPYKIPYSEDLAQAIIEAATELFGAPPVVHGLTQEDIIKSVIDMPVVITGFGPENSNLHAPNENMPVDYFIRGIKFSAAIMESFAARRK